MAELNLPMQRPVARRIGDAAVQAPRMVMSWEDWLTLAAALVCFIAVGASIQQAEWVERMPAVIPTAIGGLVVGLFAARVRFPALAVHPVAIAIGIVLVVLSAQSYADGVTLADRLEDFRVRMHEWWQVVRANDISNDNLPFVTLVHAVTFLAAYLGAWSIYRWHNAWLALIPGAVVLLANISFLDGHPAAAFVVFMFGALVLIARLHLQKNMARWSRQGVDYPELISLNSLQITIVLSAILIVAAWMVPLGKQANAVESIFDNMVKPATNRSETFVRLFHNIDSRKGAQLHTFGSTLPIQGTVTLGTKPLMEVQSGSPGLIRATSYDEYTGNGWKATDRDTTRVDARELAEEETSTGYLKRVVTILRVKILDNESTILTAGTPLTTNVDTLVDTPDGFNGDIERMRSRRALDENDTYNSFGSESRATAGDLQGAGTEYPAWVTDRYLQLPDDLPASIAQETQRVITEAGATNPYDMSVAVQDFLRTFPYNLNVESAPPGEDTCEFFLFRLKQGYFDYQATCMAVMLRTQGIPARIAVGYLLDPSEQTETTYVVRKDDAYSWVEVFFPQYGWVPFNPTQDRPAGGAGGIGAGAGSSPSDPVIDVELLPNILGSGELDIEPTPLDTALQETPIDQDNSSFPWWIVYTIAGVIAFIGLLLLIAKLVFNWGLGGLEGRAKLWAKVQRLAGWAGLGSHEPETPREWSSRMGQKVGYEPQARSLAMAYEEARYGRPDLQRIDEEETVSAYKQVRSALVKFILRRRKSPVE